jgi:hypothetical protein
MILQSLEIPEEKRFVPLQRPAQRGAELVPLKPRRGCQIEKVSGIERVVAKILKQRPVQIIRARTRHDFHLRSGPFAVFGCIAVAQRIEFFHRVRAQQLLARAAWLHIVFRRARELDSVQQE